MPADDFVEKSDTPEVQKQVQQASKYTRKYRVTVNLNKCAVRVCNEDKREPVDMRWSWGEEELPKRGPVSTPWRGYLKLFSRCTRE